MKIVKVIGNINKGGFGNIDKVLCDDGLEYARKTFCPAPQFQSDPDLIDKLKKRFVREVKTQEKLPDEYFMPILFEDLNASTPYFIMPIADGVYTEEIDNSKKESRNPEGLSDILNALEFLHDRGLVHRDLKPQNILKHNGSWKLADFGLISQDKEILSQTITTSKNAFGTTMYCAPEQLMEFKRITPQADIYSFGAILHDIFTDGNRVPHSQLSASGEIGYVIQKCTQRKKEQRFKTVKSLRSKVLTILAKGVSGSTDKEEEEWLNNFKELSKWDGDTFESFILFLKRNESFADVVFYEIDEESLTILSSLSSGYFNELSILYCEWVFRKSFSFGYCDVVIVNLFLIYGISDDVEVKAKCAISSAELGKAHNRWFVMKYVLKMCSATINPNLAFRIGLEIGFDSRNKLNFIRCAENINLTKNSYHKHIAENLE